MEKEEESIDQFEIACLACEKKGVKHQTSLYVDWKKKYYMIICYTCQASEAFDEFGKKIKIVEKN